MDGAAFAPFPHHSWFTFRVTSAAAARPFTFHMRSVAHVVSLAARGTHSVRWITRGRETAWKEQAGTVHFMPADGDDHAFVTAMSPGFESVVFLVPEGHLRDGLAAEGVEGRLDLRRVVAPDDPQLRGCLARLARLTPDGHDLDDDVAARRLVLRLAELAGGGRPDWHADGGTFDGRTERSLVDYIDAHLTLGPALEALAALVNLSPSHFARKFRLSTGLSLQRFVNRRRLQAAFAPLKDDSRPLATVALDLGFSSQSHFTRLFSSLTGMTPAAYRRQFRRTIG